MPNPKLETYKNKATNTVYDLTDADAQSQLTAIKDGTTIDSFGDAETALSTKYDINDESQISILDYDYVPYYAEAESASRKIYWTNIKNGLKGFFDDLYCAIGLVPSGASSSNKLATASDVAAAFPRSEQAVLGANNFFDSKSGSSSGTGILFAVNADESVSMSAGTASTECYFGYQTNKLPVGKKAWAKYGDTAIANLRTQVFYKATEAGNWTELANVTGNVAEFTIPNSYYVIWVRFSVAASKAVSASTLYPQISLSANAPYAPYAMTNKELTEKVTPVEGTVTSGFTVDSTYTHLYKVGKVVVANIKITNITSATAYSTNICTIPEGFRPTGAITFMAHIAGAHGIVEVYKSNGGVISNTAITNSTLMFSGTWVTD